MHFEIQQDPKKKNFFSDLINSISSAVFAKDGPEIFVRDYINVRIWDVRKQDQAVRSIPVADYMEKNLCNLYENESIYDKFFLKPSPCSNFFLTGAYNKQGHIIDRYGSYIETMTCNFDVKPM